jgi:subtilisin-like proprotein convertase family protein
MNKNLLLSGLMLLALAGPVAATIVKDQDFSVGQVIPDNNPSGFTVSQTFSGLDISQGNINEVDMRLNLTGGFNGDLYGYLVLQSADTSTTTVLLLNQIGTDMSHPYGNSGSDINVTLSSAISPNNIHNAAFGNVAGNYTPDGNATALNALNGHDPNGTWTLFLADLSTDDQSTLVSWGLNISVVPEPVTYALGIFAAALGGLVAVRRFARQG